MSSEGGALDSLKIDRSQAAGGSGFPWLIFGLLLLVVGGGVAGFMTRAPRVRVQTAKVREGVSGAASAQGPQTVLNASGYVKARRAATVSSKVMGKVTEVLIEEGMKVEEGQVLARLDDSNVKAGLRLAEARVESARRMKDELLPSLDFARKESVRFQELRDSNAVSQSDKSRAESSVTEFEARIERLSADIEVAARQVDDWKQQVADMVICAPFAGVITTKDAQPGEIISPMSSGGFTRTGIGTVVDMSSLEIEVDVNESYINRVKPGLPAEATLDAYSDWRIPCKVIAIIPTADRQKATVKVRIGFDQPDARIFPEMGVKVAFQTAAVSPSAPVSAPVRRLVIPAKAVQKVGERSIVWVVKNERVERRAITAGAAEGDELSIASGLTLGESVLINPPPGLKEGDSVKVDP
jgi:RND family efflux transporter MFP subunit